MSMITVVILVGSAFLVWGLIFRNGFNTVFPGEHRRPDVLPLNRDGLSFSPAVVKKARKVLKGSGKKKAKKK